jgi:hypothetical protein
MKYRYLVFDVYDLQYGEQLTKQEIIGKANTKQEIKNIWNTQDDETDGECYIIIYDRVTKNFVEYKDIKV